MIKILKLRLRNLNNSPKECPRYDSKLSDSLAPVLELWGMWRTRLLPLLPGPLWPRVVVPQRVPCLGQIELFNHLTACKKTNDYY